MWVDFLNLVNSLSQQIISFYHNIVIGYSTLFWVLGAFIVFEVIISNFLRR